MMENEPKTKAEMELASFFDAAKDADAVPNAAFLIRVEEDARAQTKGRERTIGKTKANPLSKLFHSIGGWQTAAALTACACVGILAGYSTPDSLDYLNGSQPIAETSDEGSFSVASDIETLFQEG